MEVRLNATHLVVAVVAIVGAFALVEVADAMRDMVGAFTGSNTEHRRDRDKEDGARRDKEKADKERSGRAEVSRATTVEHPQKKDARKEWRDALSSEELKAHRQQMRDKRIAENGVDPREERRERRKALEASQLPANLPFAAPDVSLGGITPPSSLQAPADTDAYWDDTD